MRTIHGVDVDDLTGVRYLLQNGECINLHDMVAPRGGVFSPRRGSPHIFRLNSVSLSSDDLRWYEEYKRHPLVRWMLPTPKVIGEDKTRVIFCRDKEQETTMTVLKLLELCNPTRHLFQHALGAFKNTRWLDTECNIVPSVVTSITMEQMADARVLSNRCFWSPHKLVYVCIEDIILDRSSMQECKIDKLIDNLPRDLRAVGAYHLKLYLKEIEYE